MTNRISMSLLIAALLAASSAFARPVNPADIDSPVMQARADLSNARCVLAAEDSRCQAAR
jgi:hypothetical protein